MRPLVSVIVPVYRVEKYLPQCVDSILEQTYTNLEVILVDDGSPDGCGAICDAYAAKDSRVKVIHKQNGGLSDARNAGMAVMTGEYVSFVDSDDMLAHHAVEVLLRIAQEKNADLVIGGHDRFEMDPCEGADGREAKVRCMTNVEAMADMLQNGCASWARLYRSELHAPVLFPVGEINEDEAIVLHLLDRCKCVAMTDAVVYYYRCREESITTSSFSAKKLAWVKHCRDNLEFIRQKYPQLELLAAARYRGSILWALREIALQESGYDEEWEQLRRELRENRRLFCQNISGRDRMMMTLLGHCARSVAHHLLTLRSSL